MVELSPHYNMQMWTQHWDKGNPAVFGGSVYNVRRKLIDMSFYEIAAQPSHSGRGKMGWRRL
jgi:hypothetical protein